MIELDEQQDRVLRHLAGIVGRGRGHGVAANYLRSARLIARVGLTINRFFAPRSFDRWNRNRIEQYRREAAQ